MTRTVEAPAELLDKTIETTIATTTVLSNRVTSHKAVKKAEDYWDSLGPGLTTGAADDDPSGILTYSQTGAQYGFSLLWLAPLTFPLMAVVQEMCARIGLATGRGLASNIKSRFSKRALYICAMLLFVANTFNIGADLGAMAQATRLLTPTWGYLPLVAGFTLIMLGLQIFTPYKRYAKYLKWLAFTLFAYIFSALLAHIDWGQVLTTAATPHLTFHKDQLLLICAILGTTISPYLFFWQTSQEVEEQILHGNTTIGLRQRAVTKLDIRSMRTDIWSGMVLSNVVMFFIIAACGALLFTHGIINITSSAQAAEALRPFAGNITYFLFTLGIIGTGMLSIPVLAGSSSYAITESLNKQGSLGKKLKQAYAFYGVIIISMLAGLAMNFLGINPIKALIWSAVLNGLIAPVILVFIVLLSSNHKVMGEWKNRRLTSAIGWITVLIMTLSGLAAIYSLF